MWVAGGVVAVAGLGCWVSVSVRSMNSLGLVVVGGCGGRIVGIDVLGWVVECALGCVVVPAAVVWLGVTARGGGGGRRYRSQAVSGGGG